ncbi:MAG: exodeoxyribonuclease large subunit [Clostridia bacterium]|nr:exodeoxyribonuclease large subunit [Clostridia bacterium]
MLGRRVLAVSELTAYLKNLIEKDGRLTNVWVKGEVVNFKLHSSGHLYFSLRDRTATLRCVYFNGRERARELRLADGLEVIARGYVSVYPRDGLYQLYAQEIFLAGAGAWQLALAELKKKLEKEGLLDPSRKRPLPFLPRQVGLITSPDGAALRDMVTIIRRRCPTVDLILAPVTVQGDSAPLEIVRALAALNRCGGVDVIILGRGGGSSEDLAAFNTEMVARAIYASRIPVVTAVGHATDMTLADLVADRWAPTPSAAAEMVVPVKADLEKNLEILGLRLNQAVNRKLASLHERLHLLSQSRGLARPRQEIYYRQQHLDGLERRLLVAGSNFYRQKENALASLAARLEAASPVRILSRGYAVCRKLNGEVISDFRQVDLGEAVEVVLKKGLLQCRVEALRGDGHA